MARPEPKPEVLADPVIENRSTSAAGLGWRLIRWDSRTIDSRTCRFTNKTQLAEWVELYGENSDFVRVRVRGLPPAASDLQYIDNESVAEAQRRYVECLPDDALVCGLDVARGGGDHNVFCFRRGPNARSVPAIRIPGEETRDSMAVSSQSEPTELSPKDTTEAAIRAEAEAAAAATPDTPETTVATPETPAETPTPTVSAPSPETSPTEPTSTTTPAPTADEKMAARQRELQQQINEETWRLRETQRQITAADHELASRQAKLTEQPPPTTEQLQVIDLMNGESAIAREPSNLQCSRHGPPRAGMDGTG